MGDSPQSWQAKLAAKRPELFADVKPAPKAYKYEEHKIQVEAVSWFRAVYSQFDELFYAVPNGARRDKRAGKRLKDEGMRRGIPDLILDLPRGRYAGLRAETKTETGDESGDQKEVIAKMRAVGFYVFVYRDAEEFKKEVRQYLALGPSLFYGDLS
jgi:hypothetical protein